MIPKMTPKQVAALEGSGYELVRSNGSCVWIKDLRGLVARMDWCWARTLADLLSTLDWEEGDDG